MSTNATVSRTPTATEALTRIAALVATIETFVKDETLRTPLLKGLETVAGHVREMNGTLTAVKNKVKHFRDFPPQEDTGDPMDELEDARDTIAAIGKLVNA